MEGPALGSTNKQEQYVMPRPLEEKLREDEARARQERQARAEAALVGVGGCMESTGPGQR